MLPCVSVKVLLTVTILEVPDKINPLALLRARLVKAIVPVMVCAVVPAKVHVPLPDLKVPVLVKFPLTGMLVVAGKADASKV